MFDSVSERLAFARKLCPVSAARLGELAGLSRATVSLIEAGERSDPAGSTILKLADVLGVSKSWLLAGEGAPPTKDAILAAVAAAEAAATPKATGTGAKR